MCVFVYTKNIPKQHFGKVNFQSLQNRRVYRQNQHENAAPKVDLGRRFILSTKR